MKQVLKNYLRISSRQEKCYLCGLRSPSFKDPKALKLHFIKCVINQVTPFLAEEYNVEPSLNVTMMLQRVFDRVRENLKVHPDKFFKDQNFPMLIDAVEKVLVFIAEKDSHYRGQVAYVLMAVTGEVESAFKLKRQKDPSYTTFEFHRWLSNIRKTELKKA